MIMPKLKVEPTGHLQVYQRIYLYTNIKLRYTSSQVIKEFFHMWRRPLKVATVTTTTSRFSNYTSS